MISNLPKENASRGEGKTEVMHASASGRIKKPSSGLYKQANLMMQNPADRRRHPTNIAIVVMDHGHMGILDAVFELGDLHPFGTGGL